MWDDEEDSLLFLSISRSEYVSRSKDTLSLDYDGEIPLASMIIRSNIIYDTLAMADSSIFRKTENCLKLPVFRVSSSISV